MQRKRLTYIIQIYHPEYVPPIYLISNKQSIDDQVIDSKHWRHMPYRFIDYSFTHWTFNSIPHSINYVFFFLLDFISNIILISSAKVWCCSQYYIYTKAKIFEGMNTKKKSAKGYFMMKKYVIKKGTIFWCIKDCWNTNKKLIWFLRKFWWPFLLFKNKSIKRAVKSIIH